MNGIAPTSRRARGGLVVLALSACLLPSARAQAPQLVFASDGESLEPFPCHYVSGQFVPTIQPAAGGSGAAIEFATPDLANFSLAPYVLPRLGAGQVLRGSLDFKIEGETNLAEIAGFGISVSASCDYTADDGPADGRWPLPSIFYYSAEGVLGVVARNRTGDVELGLVPFPISLGSWHRAELSFAPAPDGAYDFALRIDGDLALAGRSFEELRGDDALGVLLGAVGSGYSTRVQYDNVQVELSRDESACSYAPDTGPLTFVRGPGGPVIETAAWESCGGRGRMALALAGVTSARVFLNGEALLEPDDFHQNLARIEIPVALLGGENRLEVELRGQPGASLAVLFTPAAGGDSPRLDPVLGERRPPVAPRAPARVAIRALERVP